MSGRFFEEDFLECLTTYQIPSQKSRIPKMQKKKKKKKKENKQNEAIYYVTTSYFGNI